MAGINFCSVDEEFFGYTSDLSLLFKQFDQTGSLRFEDFSTVWKNLNFSFIHCGKRSSCDKVMGTERLLRCTTGFFNPETPLQYRVAAVYAAYAVYYTQLCHPKVKIRMTVTMWKDLKDLQQLVREHKHPDVDYVITKLENDKAFFFTAMPKPLEYGNRELMTNMETQGTAVYTSRQYYQPNQYVEDTVQSLDFVESIAYLEDEYSSVKEDILKSVGKEADAKTLTCLKAIREDLRSNLVDDVEQFREWMESNAHAQALLDTSQRPATKQLRHKEDIEGNEGDAGNESLHVENTTPTIKHVARSSSPPSSSEQQTIRKSRADRLQALRLKSFRNLARNASVDEDSLSKNCDSTNDTKEEGRVFYRRSATLEREVRPWVRKWKGKRTNFYANI